MIDVSGLILTEEEKTQLAKPSIGGVILFSRNFENIHQVKALIKSIRLANQNLLIAVDHEGGRVQRFREGFTHIPAMAKLGEVYDQNSDLALQQAYSCGFVLAYELLEVGIDFSFAPVIDLDYGNNTVIGDRAFSNNKNHLIALAIAFINGVKQTGMVSVAKHFPGHGFVDVDSHFKLPIDNRDFSAIADDIEIFKQILPIAEAVMPAHIIYNKIDDKPAGFSQIWLQNILKKQIGYNGIIISDDLNMQAAINFETDVNSRVMMALTSGCDMVLLCNNLDSVAKVIDNTYSLSNKLQIMCAQRLQQSHKTKYIKHLKTIQQLQ